MDPKKLSIQELLQLCLATQDAALWQEFVCRVQPLISKVVGRTVRRCRWRPPDPALVDDLIQDTFMKLFANDYRALREFQFEDENRFFGFIKTVASHVVQDYIRKVNSDKHGGGLKEEDIEKESITLPAPSSNPDRQILINQILYCLQRLSSQPNFKRDMLIFQLYYFDGLTAADIGDRPDIGLGVKTVESALLRLIRFLKGELGGRGTASGR
jgi:RNA polymerase sigma factor (sigma-70 family)